MFKSKILIVLFSRTNDWVGDISGVVGWAIAGAIVDIGWSIRGAVGEALDVGISGILLHDSSISCFCLWNICLL